MPDRLNILQIVPHDLGKHLHCYGRPDVSSPNLDRLAAEGLRFDRCFTASAPCSPGRACIQSGRYAHSNGQIGLTHRGFDLPEKELTITDHLNQAGYLTANIGFQHERKDPTRNRYQHLDLESQWCEVVAEKVAEFLAAQARRGDRPFYLNAAFREVHLPFDREVYFGIDPAEADVPPWLPDNQWVRQELALIAGSARWMDQAVGVMLDALARTGLDRNTLVLFVTDHGIAFPRAKAMLYDPGIETALIMRLPEAFGRSGVICEELISNVDIAPTLLDLVGAPTPDAIQGRSFRGLLAGEPYAPREEIFSEKNYQDIYDPIRCVRTARHKYVRNYEKRTRVTISMDQIWESTATLEMWPWASEWRPEEELYDLQSDPYEMTNLAERPEMGEVLEEMRGRLRAWMVETEDPLLTGRVPAPEGAQVDTFVPPSA